MSYEFQLEQEHPLDWLKESSHLTNNHPSFSDLSKDHFLDDLLQPPPPNSRNHQRNRCKVNSKNYRERKKNQFQNMHRQFDSLQRQNAFLRRQKHCRWCQRNFDHPVYCKQGLTSVEPEDRGTPLFSKSETINYKPEFQTSGMLGGKKSEGKGKVWMALGILLLVLGLGLYGFDGEKRAVKQIEIQRSQVDRWSKQFSSVEDQYIDVQMTIKEHTGTISKAEAGELRIIYQPEEAERGPSYNEDKVSINKELLLGIQAELDDVGFYL